MKRLGSFVPAAAVILGWQSAAAEEPGDAATAASDGTETQTEAAAADSGALQIGSFVLDPRLTLTEFYDDNIFATRNHKVHDAVTVVSPSLRLDSDWGEHALSVYGSMDVGRHANRSSEDYVDWRVGGEGRVDFSPEANLFGGARFTHDHEPRSSPDEVNGTGPTLFDEIYGFAGGSVRFDPLSVRAAGTYRHIDFDDVDSTGGTINNDDRDRALTDIGARVGYLIEPGWQAFVQGALDLRDYDDAVDDAGVDRDSAGFNAAAGMVIGLENESWVELLAGYLHQDYDGVTLEDVDAFDFGARLTWRPTLRTTVTGIVDRTIAETTATGASSYLATRFGAGVEHLLAPDLSAQLSADYTFNDYVGITRSDRLLDANLGLAYYVTPHIWLGTDYSYQRRESEAAGEDYDENRLFFRIGAQWAPHYSDEDMAAYRSGLDGEADLGGFYAGVQGGVGELNSGLEGPRGAGGSLTADFGALGWTGGAFGGYGERFGNWYLAGELEVELSGADWTHTRLPGGRQFMVDKQETLGGSGLIGYFLPADNLVYGRFGVVGTRFETTYVTSAGTTNVRDEFEPGLRFGGGVEVPAGGGLFVRLDQTYTAYRNYQIEGGNGLDDFSNTENLTRLGIGYRFGMLREGEPDSPDNPLAGFYFGGQLGHDGLVSANSGPRQAGSVLDAERGGYGASAGVYGGYGLRLDDFYLAGELDAEISDASWDIERDPTGRVYSVDKHHSVGASLIAGYVLGDAALLYGRVGLVRTLFHTDYATTGTSTSEDNTQTGLRFGSGVEVPASDTVSLRFDFTYTDYESFDVEYGANVDRFDNAENQFRIGLAYRF
ncbi:MAG: outer membrane beta-barrel protein [Alphaproteobacteria bacterium]